MGKVRSHVALALLAGGYFADPRAPVEFDAGSPSVTILPRTPHLRTYPCVEQCHTDREPDPNERVLDEFHTLRSIRHGETMFWCPFCHKPDNLDRLQLLDGTDVSFDAAYRLCGQCHGDKVRDFHAGIHGLTTGSWQTTRERRSCPVCHDPHDPHRPQFRSLPPPTKARGRPEAHHE